MTPPLLAVIGVLFLGIGGFSFLLAQKRMRFARAQGQPSVWYKNLTLMTSIEYILLGIIIFLNLASSQIPAVLRAAFDILYAIILLLAIIFLFTVVFLGFKQPRRGQPVAQPQAASTVEAVTVNPQSSAERAAEQQRKRERRQKAAEARRRHAGRA
jgi:hypothetical protein